MAQAYVTATAHIFIGLRPSIPTPPTPPPGSDDTPTDQPGTKPQRPPFPAFKEIPVPPRPSPAGPQPTSNPPSPGLLPPTDLLRQPPEPRVADAAPDSVDALAPLFVGVVAPVVAAALRPRPIYLGSAEISPRIEIVRSTLPWYDDEVGTSQPHDDLWEGESAVVVADLTRWNEPVYAAIAAVVNGIFKGTELPGAVGTSLMMEGAAHVLWVQFPYSAKLAMALGGLVAGYRFPFAHLEPDTYDRLGYQPSCRRLTWTCRRFTNVVTGAGVLYDHNMRGLPVVN